MGLKRVFGERLRCLAYVEREAFSVANLLEKIEAGDMAEAPIFTDVTTFPAHKFRGLVDIFCGGYPCQPESVAGNQLGTKDPRFLWPYCREFVAATRPVWCFFENVRGHVNTSMVEVIRDLAGLQYAVEPGIFSAEECGGSHSRERVFILARDTLADSSNIGREAGPWFGRAESQVESTPGLIERTGNRSQYLAHPHSPRRPQPQGGIGELGGWAVNGLETVADTIDKGPQGEQQRGTLLRDRYRAETHGPIGKLCGSRLPSSPPGPNDADGWANVLRFAPWLAPSLRWSEAERIFRRVANGLENEPHLHPLRSLFCENRVDRLRMLGNGVYPESAATAFVTLMQKFAAYD